MTMWVAVGSPGGDGKAAMKDQTCAICIMELDDDDEDLNDVVRLGKCVAHYVHKACIMEAFKRKTACPTCGIFYGAMEGDMPAGTMNHRVQKGSLPGYPGCGTIVITYNFPNGTQGPEHPNPGKPYYGTSRTAYLPDNKHGREALAGLEKAFKQKVSFTVGTSLTTGRSDQVIWNGIHHKTSPSGGMFGYPDPLYLTRLKEELATKGIVV